VDKDNVTFNTWINFKVMEKRNNQF